MDLHRIEEELALGLLPRAVRFAVEWSLRQGYSEMLFLLRGGLSIELPVDLVQIRLVPWSELQPLDPISGEPVPPGWMRQLEYDVGEWFSVGIAEIQGQEGDGLDLRADLTRALVDDCVSFLSFDSWQSLSWWPMEHSGTGSTLGKGFRLAYARVGVSIAEDEAAPEPVQKEWQQYCSLPPEQRMQLAAAMAWFRAAETQTLLPVRFAGYWLAVESAANLVLLGNEQPGSKTSAADRLIAGVKKAFGKRSDRYRDLRLWVKQQLPVAGLTNARLRNHILHGRISAPDAEVALGDGASLKFIRELAFALIRQQLIP